MQTRLKQYVDGLFTNAPNTAETVEIKEEILQNTIDRYNDLIAEGKAPQEAYSTAVAGIGDVSGLIGGIGTESSPAYDTYESSRNRTKRGILLAVAVSLYILCILPPILLSDTPFEDNLGPALMFVFVAAATGLLIYRSAVRVNAPKSCGNTTQVFQQTNQAVQNETAEKNPMKAAVLSAVWAAVLAVYFLVSFLTGGWYITWIIFLIGGAVSGIVRAAFDLKK